MALLAVEKITMEYKGVRALNGVSLSVGAGRSKGLIGPNGAGKSTLFHLITGFEMPPSGKIFFKGEEITELRPQAIAMLGIGRTFQTVQTLSNMSVVENVMVGMHKRLKGGIISSGLRLPWAWNAEREALEDAKKLLSLFGLLGRWEWPASQLSFGEQRVLEIARAAAMKPELLLLDEPAAGLSGEEVRKLCKAVRQLNEAGTTFLIVEHQMTMILEVADEIAVLKGGDLIADGPSHKIMSDSRVIETCGKGSNPRA